MSEFNLFTAEPTPTPEAPVAIVRGVVTELMPDATIVGMLTVCEMTAVTVSVGASFSISPCAKCTLCTLY
jgi:hypothetical protein